jgi:uncharacterized protein
MPLFIDGLCIGITGGLISGLFGVSPGGVLVPVTILFIGCGQHVAQGISLVCQIAPTGLASIRRYREQGWKTPWQWLLLLVAGFFLGSIGGAAASLHVADRPLQWTYVGYLLLLEVLLLARKSNDAPKPSQATTTTVQLNPLALLLVGIVAGLSSGFLGIGGGLAVVVGLSGALKLPQHLAQQTSLVLSLLPLTAPAAWVYWQEESFISWWLIAGVVAGLWIGGDVGARLAVRIAAARLRQMLALVIVVFAAYMAAKALQIV